MHGPLRKIVGYVLVIIGIIALITPFTPGAWLMFVGGELLGVHFVFAHKMEASIRRQGAWFMPIACILGPFVAGAVGFFFTEPSISTWYAFLTKPSWTPPDIIFGPVWIALYLLMGIAALLVWRTKKRERGFALEIFFAHLFLNAQWSFVFFGLHKPLYGMVIISLLWLMIAWLIVLFARQSRVGGWLLVPYFLWVSYAAALNLSIVLLN